MREYLEGRIGCAAVRHWGAPLNVLPSGIYSAADTPACHRSQTWRGSSNSVHKAHKGAQGEIRFTIVPLKHHIKIHGSYNLPPSKSHHSSAPGVAEASWGCQSAGDVEPAQPEVNLVFSKCPLCPAVPLGSAQGSPQAGSGALCALLLLRALKAAGRDRTREKMRTLCLSWLTSVQIQRKRTQSHFYLTVVLYLLSSHRISD